MSLNGGANGDADGSGDANGGETTSMREVQASELLDLFEIILSSPYSNPTIRQYVLVASTKLSARLDEVGTIAQTPESKERINRLVNQYLHTVELDTQARSVEFAVLLNSLEQNVRIGVLERMPPPELKATVMGTGAFSVAGSQCIHLQTNPGLSHSWTVSEKRAVGSTRADKDSLLDLAGDGDPGVASPTSGRQNLQTTQDLLADIFGMSSSDAAPPAGGSAATAPRSQVDDIMSLFGGGGSMPAAAASGGGSNAMPADLFSSPAAAAAPATRAPSQPAALSAFTSPISGLAISFIPAKDASKPNVVNITTKFSAAGAASPLSGINFQAAVPKTMKLQMMAITSADLAPGQEATQLMRVMVPPGAQIRLRLRLSYTFAGEQRQEQTDFAFPQGSF